MIHTLSILLLSLTLAPDMTFPRTDLEWTATTSLVLGALLTLLASFLLVTTENTDFTR